MNKSYIYHIFYGKLELNEINNIYYVTNIYGFVFTVHNYQRNIVYFDNFTLMEKYFTKNFCTKDKFEKFRNILWVRSEKYACDLLTDFFNKIERKNKLELFQYLVDVLNILCIRYKQHLINNEEILLKLINSEYKELRYKNLLILLVATNNLKYLERLNLSNFKASNLSLDNLKEFIFLMSYNSKYGEYKNILPEIFYAISDQNKDELFQLLFNDKRIKDFIFMFVKSNIRDDSKVLDFYVECKFNCIFDKKFFPLSKVDQEYVNFRLINYLSQLVEKNQIYQILNFIDNEFKNYEKIEIDFVYFGKMKKLFDFLYINEYFDHFLKLSLICNWIDVNKIFSNEQLINLFFKKYFEESKMFTDKLSINNLLKSIELIIEPKNQKIFLNLFISTLKLNDYVNVVSLLNTKYAQMIDDIYFNELRSNIRFQEFLFSNSCSIKGNNWKRIINENFRNIKGKYLVNMQGKKDLDQYRNYFSPSCYYDEQKEVMKNYIIKEIEDIYITEGNDLNRVSLKTKTIIDLYKDFFTTEEILSLNIDRIRRMIRIENEKELSNINFSNREAEIRRIKDIIEKREIKSLFHFSRIENLENICLFGIIPRSFHNELSLNVLYSDNSRLDQKLHTTSLSISFPNIRMMYVKKKENMDMVLFCISSEILYEGLYSQFYKSNAAKSEFKNYPNIDFYKSKSFETMFDNDGRSPSLKPHFPTDIQAEILYSNIIDFKNIKCIILESNLQLDYIKLNFPKLIEKIEILIDKRYFYGG